MEQIDVNSISPARSNWKELLATFIAGAFGGMSPFLLRLAMDFVNNRSRIDYVTLSIVFGISLLAFLGGGVAAVFKEKDLKKAFYLGVGLPSLLTVVTSNTPVGGNLSQISAAKGTGIILLAVHAAGKDSGPAPGRKLSVNVPSSAGDDISFMFTLADGNAVTINQPESRAVASVPSNASSVTITSQYGESDSISLPALPNSTIELTLTAENDPWYGFWYALGRHVKPYKLLLGSLKTNLPPEPISFRVVNSNPSYWQPRDLAIETDGTFIALDDFGRVDRLAEAGGSISSQRLFVIPIASKPRSIASNDRYIFATSNGISGCVLYMWEKESQRYTTHPFFLKQCSGVAIDGEKLYLAFDDKQTILSWNNLEFLNPTTINVSPSDPSLANSKGEIALAVDASSHELFIGNKFGDLFVVRPDKRIRTLGRVGAKINSIALSANFILVASSGGVACFDRSAPSSERGMGCLRTRVHDEIVGVRVDRDQRAWLLERNRDDFMGPILIQ